LWRRVMSWYPYSLVASSLGGLNYSQEM